MSAALWFLVAGIIAAFALAVAGTLRALVEGRALAGRASSMRSIGVDVHRYARIIQRIQDDLIAIAGLLVRAGRALRAIDTEVRAMLRAFSRE